MNNHCGQNTITSNRWLVGIVVILIALVLLPTFSFAAEDAEEIKDITNFTQVSLPTGDVVYQDPATGKFYLPNGKPAQIDTESGLVTNIERPLVTGPTTCEGWDFLKSPIICFGRMVGGWFAGLLVFVTAWILTIAGVLFNWTLDVTIVNFAKFINVGSTGVMAGINTVWTAGRDVSNIFIIGMFVFIAISMILGLKEYGQKRLVAQILVIAVLINFSLLFTKIIIDASNFTALQFYKAAAASNVLPQVAGTGASQPSAGNTTSQAKTYGVAGAFMDYAGVAGFADTKDATQKLADKLDNGFMAMLHGIFIAVLFLAAAAVLLYGTFLLITRGILMIFLMMTASLAFASHLLPAKLASKSYGWDSWWSSLLQNAVFAPILMFFLWAVLLVAKKMAEQSGTLGVKGTLGDLLTNPTNAYDMTALFAYIVTIGLLFGAIKISSSFAGTIGGFNWTSIGPLIGASAFARLGGVLGRGVIGGGANFLSGRMMQGARMLEAKQDKTGWDKFKLGALYYGSKPIKGVAQRDFNAMKTGLGDRMFDAAKGALTEKNKKLLLGRDVGGRLGSLKRQQEKYARQGEELRRTPEDRRKIAVGELYRARALEKGPPPKDEGATKAREEVLKERPDLAKQKSDADELVKRLETSFTESTASIASKNRGELEEIVRRIGENKSKLSAAEAALKIAPQDTARLKEKRDIEASIERDKSREKQLLNEQDTKLKTQLEAAKDVQRKVVEAIDRVAKVAGKLKTVVAREKTAPQIGAERAERRLTNLIWRGITGGKNLPGNAFSEDELRKAVIERKRTQREERQAGRIAERWQKRAESRPAPASAPPPAPPAPPAT